MSLRLVLSLLFLLITVSAQDVPLCGDCWCVPDEGVVEGTCPDVDSFGVYFGFEDQPTWPDLYDSYVLESTIDVKLESQDGSDCYPFADSVGPLTSNNYPESEQPQCKIREQATDSMVCAYKFSNTTTATSNGSCNENRGYSLAEYDSKQDALDDSAMPIHAGACGVCSSAQDMAVRMRTSRSLRPISITCATAYAIPTDASTRFETLIGCYENLGFTRDCATLWAHFGATNAALCAIKCIASGGNAIALNKEEPFCEYSDCVECSASQFGEDFKRVGGVYNSGYNAGFAGDIIMPCSNYSVFDLDPCANEDSSSTGNTTTSNVDEEEKDVDGEEKDAETEGEAASSSSSSDGSLAILDFGTLVMLLCSTVVATIA